MPSRRRTGKPGGEIMSKSTVVFVVLLLLPHYEDLFAQEDSVAAKQVRRITLKDGSELVGTIESEDTAGTQFKTVSGVGLTIPRSQIKLVERLSGYASDGEYRSEDPNRTRLFLAPTARSLKNGQGYFSAYEIFFPLVAVGIADVVTLAGGISLFPFASNQLFYFAPKVTPVHVKNFHLAGGLLYVNGTSSVGDGVGIVYGLGTFEAPTAGLTVGLGWGFARGDLENKPIVLLGGEVQLSNSAKLISENWIPPNTDLVFLSLGVRFFGERLAADFALIHPAGTGAQGFPFVPWIGFAYNFGAR